MFPILLDLSTQRIALVGNGPAAERRLLLLDNDKAKYVKVFSDNPSQTLTEKAGSRLIRKFPDEKDFSDAAVVMIADFSEEKSAELAEKAKKIGKLVNVEDNIRHCDYHVPAIVRRGDLLITVSTNSASPRLARKLRQLLENMFGEEWAERVNIIGSYRKKWKEQKLGMQEIAKKTDEILEAEGWLKEVYKNAK